VFDGESFCAPFAPPFALLAAGAGATMAGAGPFFAALACYFLAAAFCFCSSCLALIFALAWHFFELQKNDFVSYNGISSY